MNNNYTPRKPHSADFVDPPEQKENPNSLCPVCTSPITKFERAQAANKNIRRLAKTEDERNRLYLILWGILREHGGSITLRRPPTAEEIDGHSIDYDIDDDGALRISLPSDVVVEAGVNLIHVARG